MYSLIKICLAKFIFNAISPFPVLIVGIIVVNIIIIRYPGNNIIDLHQIMGRDECVDFTTMCRYYYFMSKNTIYILKNMFWSWSLVGTLKYTR